MIGIQVITHGSMSKGMIESLQMIIGDQEQVGYNCLMPEESFEDFCDQILETTKSIDNGNGVLIFTDIYAASPYKAAIINSRKVDSEKYSIITGVNLPMLIEAAMLRMNMNLNDVYETLLELKESTITGWKKEVK